MKKSDYKILFISLFNDEAIGVRCLHSILHNKGYNARMLFLKISSKTRCKDYKECLGLSFTNQTGSLSKKERLLFIEFILNYKPNIIAFSLFSSNFMLYKELYGVLKDRVDSKIVLGGWQPTLHPEACISYCHMLCIGEGEKVLPELVDKLFNHQPIDDIQNLWINKGDRIIKNSVRPLVENLSLEPIPVFDDKLSSFIENDRLFHSESLKTNTRYGIFTGRGCPYTCAYCSNEYMAKEIYPKKWSKIRYRTVEHVMSELVEVKAKLPYLESINFYDEVFLPKEEWIENFFSRYGKEIALPFYCEFYPGTCSDKKAKRLKEWGLGGVWLGVQSGSERVRNEIFNRHYKNEDVMKQAHIFVKYKINVRYDFIFDNPFETFQETLESVYLMLELPQPFSMNIFSLKFFPNMQITNMALEKGIIDPSQVNDKSSKDQDNFLISMDHENSDRNFLNCLAAYISFLAVDAKLSKKEIISIIDDYRIHKSIKSVREALVPFIS